MAIEHREDVYNEVPESLFEAPNEGTMSGRRVGIEPGIEGLPITFRGFDERERTVILSEKGFGRSKRANGYHVDLYKDRLWNLNSGPAMTGEFF